MDPPLLHFRKKVKGGLQTLPYITEANQKVRPCGRTFLGNISRLPPVLPSVRCGGSGTGGNSGSQSSVTVIRSLSLGELEFRDIGEVIWKELRTALLCGVVLAAVCFVKIWLVDKLMMGNDGITFAVDLVVCLALCVTVIIAKIVGGILPLIAKALGADPAVMASPFITTIVDAVSLLVYFMFAKSLLNI